ncbi:MAG: long-chain fatty acid--CoA ligase [Zetaproteobacteria bacterium]|nr:MAG: long-chain fatty acid--CoA ligase [Zetaproteobacteria bacterium]
MPDTFDIRAIRHLPEALFRQAELHPYQPAQWRRKHGTYLPITYMELATRVRRLASGLLREGVEAGDRIAILMENRPEWAIVDYAILSTGAVSVPLYCTYRPQDIAYVLNDAGVGMAFVSGGNLLTHLLAAQQDCPGLRRIIALNPDDARLARMEDLEEGEVLEAALQERMAQIDRNALATIVYTSGTTANPKGVMLSHGNILANLDAIPDIIAFQRDEMLLSFLPLAHALERMAGHFLPYSFGISVAFAERPDTVAKNLGEARPTLMITVPRMLEVVRNRILGQIGKQAAWKQRLFGLLLKLAARPQKPFWQRWLHRWLDRRIGDTVRQRFGGRLRMLISGGAPLSQETGAFFHALGIPVIEGYGLTESAPLLTVNPIDAPRLGSVGRAIANVELRLAEDGEILARGPNIMQGYWRQPEATRQAVDEDGWLHTGDIGRIDEDGYLYITDRKKDLIVNSGGENIAPQRIEARLTGDALIDQVVIYGDRKPYLVALVVPNEESLRAWAKEQGLPDTDWASLCASPLARKHVQTRINALLAGFNPFEQIRRIFLLDEPLTIDNGMLTPTLKIKRRQVHAAFADRFEALY